MTTNTQPQTQQSGGDELIRQDVTRLVTSMTVAKTLSEEFLIDALIELIQARERAARIDELGSVQLEYGHYLATTWRDGKAMTIEERLHQLQPKPQAGEGGE